jgi:hypothetical protein
MSLFNLFNAPNPESQALQAANAERLADIERSLRTGAVPAATRTRLDGARTGRLPWTATLTPAELMIARSHGLRPVASVSATCWLHFGWSWTQGHAQGWETALRRLRAEAKAAGANAVLDVKMRTIPLQVDESMDFTLVGTAVVVDGLPPSPEPIVATVPALEFVKLLEADVVPTGIAIGAQYQWLTDWRGTAQQTWMGNIESYTLSQFWEQVRQSAHAELRASASAQGNGVLAHINFSQMFEGKGREDQPKQYLGRHIVIATTVDARRGVPFPHDIRMVVDMHAGSTPLTGTRRHHQSYASNDQEGAI